MPTVPIHYITARLDRIGIEIQTQGRRVRVVTRQPDGTRTSELEPPEVTDPRQAAARRAHLVLKQDERVNPKWLAEVPEDLAFQ